MPLILLALEGRVDFAIKTNPFGGGAAKGPPRLRDGRIDRAAVGRKMDAVFRAVAARRPKKKK